MMHEHCFKPNLAIQLSIVVVNSFKQLSNVYTSSSILSDDRLSLAEFTLICRALFRNNKGHIYLIPPNHLEEMFAVFDKNQDGKSLNTFLS